METWLCTVYSRKRIMSRLKKDEFYVIAVNQAAGVYKAEKWCYNDIEKNSVRWAARYPFCMVYEFDQKGQTLADVRKFCKELDKQGYEGTIYK